LMLTAWTTVSVRGELKWYTDVDAALNVAQQEHKAVLLDFTGSDWCPWCVRLKHEIFDQPEFAEFAGDHLVLVELDFPRQKPISHEQSVANHALAEKYQISGFPTVIVLNNDGSTAGQLGYMEGGPAPFDAKVAGFLKLDTKAAPAPEPEPAAPPKPRRPLDYNVKASAQAPVQYGSLALKAISGTKTRRMAMINGELLLAGESAEIKADGKVVKVVCKEIREDSVLITADGKSMELTLGNH
jgi:thioredoxin-related protein